MTASTKVRRVLVTGGNRGIGLEVCRQLALLGHYVFLGSRDMERGVEAAREAGATAIHLDTADPASAARVVTEIGGADDCAPLHLEIESRMALRDPERTPGNTVT